MSYYLISLRRRERNTTQYTVQRNEWHTNQAPTVADLVSTGVSVDLVGGLLVDFDERPGASVGFEESWLTLAFFFFFSRATGCKLSEIT